MRLTEHIYLVGGGRLGFGLSDSYDCHVYLVDGGGELALIDAGAGRGIDEIVDRIRFDGLDPAKLRHLLLTHAHADHSGGAAYWRERFGIEVAGSAATSAYVSAGDEERISLKVARAAGVYPADYVFRACPVTRVLAEGDRCQVGDVTLTAIETPGHSSGMLSFLMDDRGRQCLFAGDTVFHGGKVVLQNIWDCDIIQLAASLRKLAAIEIDALLPGHLAFALRNGGSHIRQAHEHFERLGVPPQIY